MPIKTFRGLLADGATEIIRLGTNQGLIGYKIKKFNIIPQKPVSAANECVLQVYTEKPGAAESEINFDNPLLIAVGVYSNQTDTTYYPDDATIVFDDVVFNQDIYITHNNATGAESCNYIITLEQIKLSLDEATVATLKDMRGNYTNQDPS